MEYDYWIVHFTNGLLNQQAKSFFRERRERLTWFDCNYCLITCNIKSLLNVPKISHISRKISQVSQFPAKSPDSRNKFVFLPKQPLLELSPPVNLARYKKFKGGHNKNQRNETYCCRSSSLPCKFA